jgi:hypothetical protein
VHGQDRIGVRQIGEVPIATILPAGLLTLNTVYNIYFTRSTQYSLPFVQGLISSSLVQWYWKQTQFDQKKAFPKIKKAALLSIPVPLVDFGSKAARDTHDRVVTQVTQLLQLRDRSTKARTANERDGLQRRAEALDGAIDREINALFGLTADEAAVISG